MSYSDRYHLKIETDKDGSSPHTEADGSLAVVCAVLNELTKLSYTLEGLAKLEVRRV